MQRRKEKIMVDWYLKNRKGKRMKIKLSSTDCWFLVFLRDFDETEKTALFEIVEDSKGHKRMMVVRSSEIAIAIDAVCDEKDKAIDD